METLGHEDGEGRPHRPLVGQAEHALRGAVEVDDPARLVRGDYRLAGRLENRREPRLLRAARLLSDHSDGPEGTGSS